MITTLKSGYKIYISVSVYKIQRNEMFGNQTLTSEVLTDLEQVLSQGDPASGCIWQHLRVFLVVTTRVCVCAHAHYWPLLARDAAQHPQCIGHSHEKQLSGLTQGVEMEKRCRFLFFCFFFKAGDWECLWKFSGLTRKFSSFWSYCIACVSFANQGLNSCSLNWECRLLTNGPLRKSRKQFSNFWSKN